MQVEVEEVYNEDIIYSNVVMSLFHLVHAVCMFILTTYNWPEPYEWKINLIQKVLFTGN